MGRGCGIEEPTDDPLRHLFKGYSFKIETKCRMSLLTKNSLPMNRTGFKRFRGTPRIRKSQLKPCILSAFLFRRPPQFFIFQFEVVAQFFQPDISQFQRDYGILDFVHLVSAVTTSIDKYKDKKRYD